MILPKYTAFLALSIIVMTTFAAVQITPAQAAVSSTPAALAVRVVPSVIPADGGTYPAVYVALVDSSGTPTLALSNVTVFLTSSNPTVGVVLNSSLMIQKGRGYAIAYFGSTPTVGTTKITASASGFTSSTTTVTTAVLRGYPTSISLTAVPPEVNSTSTSLRSGTLIVEFQDQVGQPAKAVADTSVSVYSSSPQILALNASSFTMRAGQFLKVMSFSTGFVPGSAIVTASAPQLSSGTAQVTVLGRPPLALKLYAQPGQMITSGSGRLVIALTDLQGNPTRAPSTVSIQIRSSASSILSVPTQATISTGAIYTSVTMTAGTVLGSATITASASGLESGFVQVGTNNPVGTPVALKLFVGPSPVLADHGNYSTVVVSLVNKTGLPTVSSTTSYNVILTSSHNSSVGEFGPSYFTSMTINPGFNDVIWSTVFTSTFIPGLTFLTVSAKDLLPDSGTLSTFGSVPKRIAIASLFTAVPADGAGHPALQVSLEDTFGAPAVAPIPVTILLFSSQTGIAQVASPVTIPSGESAVVVDVTTTSVSGSANITAYTNSLSSGYSSASTFIQTVTPSPSAVGAFLAPSTLAPSPTQKGSELVLQLQDSAGNPAKARLPTNLIVTSSNTAVFNQTLEVQIPQGVSYVAIPIAPLQSGSTTLTVTSAGLATATVQFQALDSPFAARLTASSLSIFTNGTATLTLSMTIDGQGVGGATVAWSTSSGSISPTTSATNSQGQATAVLTPRGVGVANVNATVKSAYGGTQNLSTQIIIGSPPVSKSSGLVAMLTTFPFVLILVAVAAIAVVLVFLLMRRRRRSSEAEGAMGEEEGAFSYLRPGTGLGLGEF